MHAERLILFKSCTTVKAFDDFNLMAKRQCGICLMGYLILDY